MLLIGFSVEAATNQLYVGRFKGDGSLLTNLASASNPTGSGTNLTQVPVGSLVVATTNYTYNAAHFYITGLTNVNDGVTANVPATIGNGFYSIQSGSGLDAIYTNGIGGFVYYDGQSLADWIVHTNAGPYAGRAWAGATVDPVDGQPVGTTSWIQGNNAALPDNTGQMGTNTTISYTSANVVLNPARDLVMVSGSQTLSVTNGQNSAGHTNLFLNFLDPTGTGGTISLNFGSTAGGSEYGRFFVNTLHGGGTTPDPAGTEIEIDSGQSLAIVPNGSGHIQLGGSGLPYSYTEMQGQDLYTTQYGTNWTMPLFFRLTLHLSNATFQKQYPGFYAVSVYTNSVIGSWYLGCAYQNNTGFSAEDGTHFSVSNTNETWRAWGGISNTFEVFVPAQFNRSIDARTNIASFQFSPTTPTNWLSIATRTTNPGQRATLEVDLGFVDAATGTPVAKVVIEQGTTITNTWICSAPGTIVSTITNHYSFRLAPSAIVTITDISRGTGASVTVANSQLTSE